MGSSAVTPRQIVNVPSLTLVGNATGATSAAQTIDIAAVMLLWISGLPTSDPGIEGLPYVDHTNRIAISGSPGLSGPITGDSADVTCDNVAITCDMVEFA